MFCVGVFGSMNVCWFCSIIFNRVISNKRDKRKLYLVNVVDFGSFEKLIIENRIGEFSKREILLCHDCGCALNPVVCGD
jgi:hypothetical protein